MIVFSSNRSGPWRIWTVRPDGDELRELTKAGPDEHDVDPAFSPDAKKILFSSTRGGAVHCGRNATARTIGPATSCGKNVTKSAKSRNDGHGRTRPR